MVETTNSAALLNSEERSQIPQLGSKFYVPRKTGP